jgi:hypothetical protein
MTARGISPSSTSNSDHISATVFGTITKDKDLQNLCHSAAMLPHAVAKHQERGAADCAILLQLPQLVQQLVQQQQQQQLNQQADHDQAAAVKVQGSWEEANEGQSENSSADLWVSGSVSLALL